MEGFVAHRLFFFFLSLFFKLGSLWKRQGHCISSDGAAGAEQGAGPLTGGDARLSALPAQQRGGHAAPAPWSCSRPLVRLLRGVNFRIAQSCFLHKKRWFLKARPDKHFARKCSSESRFPGPRALTCNPSLSCQTWVPPPKELLAKSVPLARS